jgi:hypothetical protein
MRPSILIPFLLGGALLGGCATASPPPPPSAETWIPYAGSDGIVEWKVSGPDALWVRSMMGGWYLVRTMAPCPRLRTANALGFIASPGDRLDRYSAILAEGQRCQLTSVTRSDGPPPQPSSKHGG